MEQITIASLKGAYFPSKGNTKETPVLFIHGAFADHHGFQAMCMQFSDAGYNSYAVSRRGRLNQSPKNAKNLVFTDYLQDTISIIQEIKPTPILIGHSLGGLLAMKAVEIIKDIPALVLINTAPPAMLTAQPIALPHFFPLLPKIFTGMPFKPSISAFKTLALQMLNQPDKERIANSLVPESGKVYRQMMLGQISLSKDYKKIPTLVIGSSQDRIISKGLNKKTVKKLDANYKEYNKHGHWIIEEEGIEQVTKDILNWLDNISK
jgi:pimeloyl-ACP methyl ester carboxylesterase